MTLTAHSLIAAAIVSKVTNPVVGLPLVLLSHFVVDKVPHWDIMTNKKKTTKQIVIGTFCDIAIGFICAAIFFYLTPRLNGVYFFSGVILSQFPDFFEAPHVILHWNVPGSALDYKLQKWIHDVGFDARLDGFWGIFSQIVVVSLFLLWATI
ncbi:hypothetical protein HY310_03295 [Candidatus Microgenomates bacterium]|nr:hypothetical protein [Candidatus Microgenomates bacterium]